MKFDALHCVAMGVIKCGMVTYHRLARGKTYCFSELDSRRWECVSYLLVHRCYSKRSDGKETKTYLCFSGFRGCVEGCGRERRRRHRLRRIHESVHW